MHITTHLGHRKELVLFDPQNPRAIASMVPEAFGKRVAELLRSEDAYLLGYTERRLLNELKRRGKEITGTDQRLRLQFWLEYDRMQSMPKIVMASFDISYVIGNAISKEAFYLHYVADNCLLAWILCPPVKYIEALEIALQTAINHIQVAIETIDVRDPNVSGAKLEWLLKASRDLHARRYGGGGRSPVKAVEDPDAPGEAEVIPQAELSIEELIKREREQAEGLKSKAETKMQGGLVDGQ